MPLWMAALLGAQLAVAAPTNNAPTTKEAEPVDDAEDAEDAASIDPSAATPGVRVLYTGGRGGIGAGSYLFELLRHLRAAAEVSGAELARVEAVHGVLVQEPWMLHAPDDSVAGAVEFIQSEGIRCGPPEPISAVDGGGDVLVMDWDTPPTTITVLSERVGSAVPYQRRSCTNPAGDVAVLVSPTGATGEPNWALTDFEMRQTLAGVLREGQVEHPFLIVGRPNKEAARTFARIQQMLRQAPGTLYVDAGRFVDGASSVEDGALSLHRPLGYAMLARLGPAALAPGDTELIAGAAVFHREIGGLGLPYVATNWESKDPLLDLPDVLLRTVKTPNGPVRVAFIGILDPELMTSRPALVADGVRITDPVTAVQPVVNNLYAQDPPPDVVIALTTADPEVQAKMRRGLRGVDLVLGDPSFATVRVSRRDTRVDHVPPDVKAAPLTLSLDGLATAELWFGGPEDQLDQVVSAPWLVYGEAPVDAEVMARITETRAATYPSLDRPLLPAPTENPTGTYDPDTWSQLVCESIRRRTGADSVLLDPAPVPPLTPGALTELVVVNQLASLDVLEEHRIPGDRLQSLLNRAYGHVPVACGAAPAGPPLIDGRSFEPDRVYRVVSSDTARRGTALGTILETSRVGRPLDGPPTSPILDDAGRPLTLRGATLDGLRSVRDTNAEGTAAVVRILLGAPAIQRPPLWVARVRQAALQIESFRGTNTDTYAAVPETLATSPSSFTLGSAGDVALEYSDRKVAGDLRFRTAFTKITTEGVDDLDNDGQPDPVEVETADDWQLSTSWAAAGVLYPRATKLQFSPYTELRYDSEYTPIELEDGTLNTMQSDLSLALGIAAKKVGVLQVGRIGGFASRDLALLDEKPTEYGGRMEFETVKALGPALRWSTLGDLQVFANTGDDDPSDLRMRAFGETRFALPLARALDIAVFAQGFALMGRVPATDELGGTWNLGLALQSAGAFRLNPRR